VARFHPRATAEAFEAAYRRILEPEAAGAAPADASGPVAAPTGPARPATAISHPVFARRRRPLPLSGTKG
jgi:hypothetical protein